MVDIEACLDIDHGSLDHRSYSWRGRGRGRPARRASG
jgi:hypothetical protein